MKGGKKAGKRNSANVQYIKTCYLTVNSRPRTTHHLKETIKNVKEGLILMENKEVGGQDIYLNTFL